jgi:hypothetical protein
MFLDRPFGYVSTTSHHAEDEAARAHGHGKCFAACIRYNYLTTGGGTVLSRVALKAILDCEDRGDCACGGHDKPDDW